MEFARFMSPEVVAYKLDVPVAFVKQICAQGRLRVLMLRNSERKRPVLRISPAALDEYLKKCGGTPADYRFVLSQKESARRAELARARVALRQQAARAVNREVR